MELRAHLVGAPPFMAMARWTRIRSSWDRFIAWQGALARGDDRAGAAAGLRQSARPMLGPQKTGGLERRRANATPASRSPGEAG